MSWIAVPLWMKIELDMSPSVLLNDVNCEEDMSAVEMVTLLPTAEYDRVRACGSVYGDVLEVGVGYVYLELQR